MKGVKKNPSKGNGARGEHRMSERRHEAVLIEVEWAPVDSANPIFVRKGIACLTLHRRGEDGLGYPP